MSKLHERLQHQVDTPNLGIPDCLLRIAAGLVLTALAVDGSIGAWGYLGLLLLATGAAWVCPVYRYLGVDTARGSPERARMDEGLA